MSYQVNSSKHGREPDDDDDDSVMQQLGKRARMEADSDNGGGDASSSADGGPPPSSSSGTLGAALPSSSSTSTSSSYVTPVSKVLHVRQIPDGITSAQLKNLLTDLGGAVSYVVMMPQKRQALVEMVAMEDAVHVIQYAASNPVMLHDRQILFNYSKSQELNRSAHDSNDDNPNPTPILLFTVFNPVYPITCQVLHTITSPYGRVEKIVIFRKSGLQALVKFDSATAAANARRALQGADIYAGCCTLKIDFSHTTDLNVRQNNDESWDYTSSASLSGSAPLMPYQQQQPYMSGGRPPYDDPHAGHPDRPRSPGGREPSPVIMVYNIDSKRATCDRIFNLFCLYGNVIRVKILVSKPNMAMVQMDNASSADIAVANLDKTPLFNMTLDLGHSRHLFIAGVPAPPTMGDYGDSMFNRYQTPKAAMKNRIAKPNRTLHFFGLPSATTEEHLRSVFSSGDCEQPENIKFFEKTNTDSGGVVGVITFRSTQAAAEALFLHNHAELKVNGLPATLRLSFAVAKTNDSFQPHHGNNSVSFGQPPASSAVAREDFEGNGAPSLTSS